MLAKSVFLKMFLKTGKLDDQEWNVMKQHPVIGAEKVLEPNEALRDLIPIVKYHHERLDGKGYPEGLKGREIPLAAKNCFSCRCLPRISK